MENSKNEIAGFVREKKVDENSSLLASLFVSEKFRNRKFSGFLADRVLSRSKFKKIYAIVFGRAKFVDFLLRLGGKIVKNPPQFLRDRAARARENHARRNLPTSFLLFPRRKVDCSFSANPDLILIDGGKPQLNAAAKVLGNLNLKIPIAAIAKKAEEIFLPGKSRPEKISPDSVE